MPNDNDMTATIEPVQDTAPVESAPAETSIAAPSIAPASSSVGSPAPQRETAPADGSLRTDTSANQQPQRQQIPDPSNWESRYKALQGEFTRRNQVQARQAQEFNGINPADVRAFREQQAKAHQQQLPMWNREHPQNGQFGALKARWTQTQNNYREAMAVTPVEQQEALRQKFLGSFSDQERATLAAHAQHKEAFGERFAEDPEGAIGSIIEQRVAAIIEQREQQTQLKGRAETSVGQWFKENPEMVNSQGQFMQQALTQGIPWQTVRLQAEVNFLKSKLSRSHLHVQSADERTRLARSRASITRDPNVVQHGLTYEQIAAKAKLDGVEEGGPGWMEYVAQFQ